MPSYIDEIFSLQMLYKYVQYITLPYHLTSSLVLIEFLDNLEELCPGTWCRSTWSPCSTCSRRSSLPPPATSAPRPPRPSAPGPLCKFLTENQSCCVQTSPLTVTLSGRRESVTVTECHSKRVFLLNTSRTSLYIYLASATLTEGRTC